MNKETSAVLEETAATPSVELQQRQTRQARDLAENLVSPYEQGSENLARAIGRAQFLIAYVAREGNVFEPKLLGTLIRSRQLFGSGRFTSEAEEEFWLAYNELVKGLKPISIESLEDSLPPATYTSKRHLWGWGRPMSAASRMVRRYRLLSVFSLMLLLTAQVYWLIGVEASQELEKIFARRESAEAELAQYRYEKKLQAEDGALAPQPTEQGPTLMRLQRHYSLSNQLLDTHYALLRGWNGVWEAMLFMDPFQGRNTEYNTLKFEARRRQLQEKLDRIRQRAAEDGVVNAADMAARDEIAMQLARESLAFEHDKARHRFFLNRISADFVLTALQLYFLPLLYGLLGAATYILRQLSIATREMTFTRNAGIHFRLRISLGALSGMSIGWFISPEDVSTLAVSSFALAFLVGYNVEVLFLVMDKFVQSATRVIGSRTDKEKSTGPENHEPALKSVPESAPALGETKTSREVIGPKKSSAPQTRSYPDSIELPVSISKTNHGELQ